MNFMVCKLYLNEVVLKKAILEIVHFNLKGETLTLLDNNQGALWRMTVKRNCRNKMAADAGTPGRN